MGNHTKPWDIDEGTMAPSSYTLAENWGGQINFMIPLDREGLKRCRSIAAEQHEKMKLNYELVRIDNCAKLQHLCSDVIPISSWTKAKAKILKCKSPPKPWYKPWQKPKETCKQMATDSEKETPVEKTVEKVVTEVKTPGKLSEKATRGTLDKR
jgi:hypothetical protein